MVRIGNRLLHPFHVLGFRLQQTPDIVPSRRLDRSGPLAEVTAEAVAEVQEALTDPGQQPHPGVSNRVFLSRPTILLSYVTPSGLVF